MHSIVALKPFIERIESIGFQPKQHHSNTFSLFHYRTLTNNLLYLSTSISIEYEISKKRSNHRETLDSHTYSTCNLVKCSKTCRKMYVFWLYILQIVIYRLFCPISARQQ